MIKKKTKIKIPVAEKKTEEMKAKEELLLTAKKPKARVRAKEKNISDKKVKQPQAKSPEIITLKKTILFVCSGNTCRSAMAKYIMTNYLINTGKADKYIVDSAGVAAHKGEDMPNNAKTALEKLRVSFVGHSSKMLTDSLVDNADIIVCMTNYHKNIIDYNEKCRTICEITGGTDVADPYGADENVYLKTAEHLYYSMEDIVNYFEKNMV